MTDEEPERRKDVNTRKVIEVLSKKMDERFKGVVTWEKLIAILGTAAVVIVSASWAVTGAAVASAKSAAKDAQDGVSQLRRDSGDAIQLVREELKDTRGDIRSLYRAVRTNQPQARLAAPVPELPPNPISEGDAGNAK